MNRKENAIFWTEEKIKFLKENYNKVPAINIATDLGCEKNAVIGKANRLGLTNKLKDRIKSW